jgi:hypothetical protein
MRKEALVYANRHVGKEVPSFRELLRRQRRYLPVLLFGVRRVFLRTQFNIY